MGGSDKLFADVEGKPLIFWTIQAFAKTPVIDAIILVFSQSNLAIGKALAEKEQFYRVTQIVTGGERRQDSVIEGLKHVTGGIVLIHDGARPLVEPGLIERVAKGATSSDACIPAVIPADTIKTELNGYVKETLDRNDLRAVQTPQAFKTHLLKEAYASVTRNVTDDAQIAELAGIKVSLTDGSYDNIKVTTPSDLELVRILIRKRGGVK
jgi:2-C-methyl-D-erythritol 4-phosphate cytidylyltransferase